MKRKGIGIVLIFLLMGGLSLIMAQERTERPELHKQIVKINYINAREVLNILETYTSPWGRIQLQRNRNVLIIEDTSEFLAKLLSILKEIDVRPLDLQFTVDVILGSMEIDPNVILDTKVAADPLIQELQRLLKYAFFSRLDTSLIKVQDNNRSSQRMGGQGIGLRLDLYPRHIKEDNKDAFQVELNLMQTTGPRWFDEEVKEYHSTPLDKAVTLLQTSLTLKDGDRSVVGVSKLNGGDTALILILQGKVIK